MHQLLPSLHKIHRLKFQPQPLLLLPRQVLLPQHHKAIDKTTHPQRCQYILQEVPQLPPKYLFDFAPISLAGVLNLDLKRQRSLSPMDHSAHRIKLHLSIWTIPLNATAAFLRPTRDQFWKEMSPWFLLKDGFQPTYL